MGLVEKIGRKLTGSRSNEVIVPSHSDGDNTTNETVVQRLPHQLVDYHNGRQPRQVGSHTAATKERPGLGKAAGHRSDTHVATPQSAPNQAAIPNLKTSQSQDLPRQPCVIHKQPEPNNIPPTSRLIGQPPESRNFIPNSTLPPANAPPQCEVHRPRPGSSKGNSHAVHKQPSISSSLHSERSGPPVSFTNRSKQSSQRPIGRPPNSQRPSGMSTRRMEDSAYHAGFRDAVAQLERERRERGQMMSH